jgi:hypothetical protein
MQDVRDLQGSLLPSTNGARQDRQDHNLKVTGSNPVPGNQEIARYANAAAVFTCLSLTSLMP